MGYKNLEDFFCWVFLPDNVYFFQTSVGALILTPLRAWLILIRLRQLLSILDRFFFLMRVKF
jgi:hypothetical protein